MMKTITQYGITTEYAYFLGNQKSFYIQRLDGDVPDKYIYPGDSSKYELDAQLTVLYDTFRDVFFPDLALYYSELASLPILLQCAGQDSEFTCSSEMFQELILYAESQNFPDLYRHLYLVDCQFMIGTIQNLLLGMEDAFINYFEKSQQFPSSDPPTGSRKTPALREFVAEVGRKRPHLFLPPSPRCSPPLLSSAADGGEYLVIDLILFLHGVRKCIAVLCLLQCKELRAKAVQAFQKRSERFGFAVSQSGEQDVIGQTQVLPGRESF